MFAPATLRRAPKGNDRIPIIHSQVRKLLVSGSRVPFPKPSFLPFLEPQTTSQKMGGDGDFQPFPM